MSAFLMRDERLSILVDYAVVSEISFSRPQDEDYYVARDPVVVGQTLLNENMRSVNYRYSENEQPHTFVFTKPSRKYTPVEILKLCDCYDYQACETNDYEESLAYHLICAIRQNVICFLPGYAEATWG